MKKIILLIPMLLLSLVMTAQITHAEVMQKMNARVSDATCLEMCFVFDAVNTETGEQLFDYSGICIMQQDQYKITGGAYEIYSDAVRKYIYDTYNNELLVLKESSSEGDLTENPFVILKKVDELFRYRKNAQARLVDGHYHVELKPVEKDSPYSRIVLNVDPDTFFPQSVLYLLENKDVYTAVIKTIRMLPAKSAEFYRFDLEGAPEDLLVTYGE